MRKGSRLAVVRAAHFDQIAQRLVTGSTHPGSVATTRFRALIVRAIHRARAQVPVLSKTCIGCTDLGMVRLSEKNIVSAPLYLSCAL